MKITITIHIDVDNDAQKYPGYALKEVTRRGVTYKQWYMVGPREVSLATKRAEGR
jgi:hypothetical protein